MASQLVIVSRQHPDLYVYLHDRFVENEDVEVILDRRLGDRRKQHITVTRDRRHHSRRARPDVDAQLRERSHVIIEPP